MLLVLRLQARAGDESVHITVVDADRRHHRLRLRLVDAAQRALDPGVAPGELADQAVPALGELLPGDAPRIGAAGHRAADVVDELRPLVLRILDAPLAEQLAPPRLLLALLGAVVAVDHGHHLDAQHGLVHGEVAGPGLERRGGALEPPAELLLEREMRARALQAAFE